MGAKHGGNLRALAALAGRDPSRILDFSASVNPLGPPEGLRAVLARTIDDLVHYPDPDCAELTATIARRYGVPVNQVVVGNGSSELLFALARACDFRRAIVPVPCYVDYITAVETVGRDAQLVPLKPDTDFALDWETLGAEIAPGDLVLLGQPNNPTGRMFDAAEFLAFADSHPDATLAVDEAFADFVEGYGSLVGRVPDNVIVLRSLTKFYAIPGLRLGFLAASPEIVERVRRQIPPWSVNTLAQAAGVAVLADEEYARRSVAMVSQERRWLASRLAAIAGLHVFPSQANYLLVRRDSEACDAPMVADRLLSVGLAIRTFGAGQHLDDRYFRVAVRTREENQRLCEALAKVLGAATATTSPRQSPGPTGQLRSRRKTPAIMFQGTSSNAGKSVLTAALCRVLLQDGLRVAPFKSQNMSLNSFVTADGREMGRAQVVQAQACRIEPDVRMNPILLKPNSDTGCQVIVQGKPVDNMRVSEYIAYKPQAFQVAQECYDSLAGQFDAVVLEGAGSPGEVNLKSHDIVNMRMAQFAAAPVLIVGDIDRGGVFASFVGTMEVLAPWERRQVAGWLVNRFRGDPSLLGSALDYTRQHTGRPVLGVVPFLPNLGLPQEDSVEFKSGAMGQPSPNAAVEIALIDLPHISNFTDFDAFGVESDVRLRTIRSADELDHPDAVILPGSKNTLGDLEYLRHSGLAQRIATLAHEKSTEVVGICGGLQMLGAEIRDPLAIESSAQRSVGLGLLDVCTVMAAEKTLQRTVARHAMSGLDVTGYEIHHGQTSAGGCQAVFIRPDGAAAGLASPDHRVWGTYMHGAFDADAFRRWFIDRLRVRRGLPPLGKVTACYDIEPALDRLADVFRQCVRVDEIYRLMGL